MLKRALASLLTGAAILPLMWFNVAPKGAEYCKPASVQGTYVPYTVTRQNLLGEDVQLTFGGQAQAGLCKAVAKTTRSMDTFQ